MLIFYRKLLVYAVIKSHAKETVAKEISMAKNLPI